MSKTRIDIRDQLLKGLDRPTWIVPDIITRGKIITLAAEAGTGKSILAYHLAVAVAAGAPFLGIPATPGSVLYFDEENAEDERLKYLRDIIVGMDLSTDSDWLNNLIFHDGAFREANDKWDAMLDHYLKLHKPHLVVIDTAASAFPLRGENAENDNSQATEIIKKIRKVRNSASPTSTILILAHGKPDKDGHVMNRGASAWRGASDAWWKLTKVKSISGEDVSLEDNLHETRLSHGKARAWSFRGSIRLRPFYLKDGRGIGSKRISGIRFGPDREKLHSYEER